jgi:hypothetical protein
MKELNSKSAQSSKIHVSLSCTILVLLFSIFSVHGQKKDLFNGQNLDGWVVENGNFSVEDGMIKVNRGTGWLRSEKMYTDFTITLEFRFLEKDANSGIYVRVPSTQAGDNGWPLSFYQVQCRDDSSSLRGHLGYLFSNNTPPFIYVSSYEAISKAYKPFGEWHTFEITCNGGYFIVKLNGEIITMAMDVETSEGYIGIQGEYGLLEFRKIQLQKW